MYTYSFKINASAKCLIFSIAETQANWSFALSSSVIPCSVAKSLIILSTISFASLSLSCRYSSQVPLSIFTELKAGEKDIYPLLRQLIDTEEYYNKEKVRNEIFKTFGYYVTESSGHNSEYTPWFRKRPDLIRRYCSEKGANGNPGEHAFSLKLRQNPNRFDCLVKEFMEKPLVKERGHEYAANILNARIGDGAPFDFNANVLNNGSVKNLPFDACVEIPVTATKDGYVRRFSGSLPTSVAPLVAYTASIESLTVEAWAKKSKALVCQAISMDPLCSAVLSLEEIREMCEELFEINKDYLGDYR